MEAALKELKSCFKRATLKCATNTSTDLYQWKKIIYKFKAVLEVVIILEENFNKVFWQHFRTIWGEKPPPPTSRTYFISKNIGGLKI